MALKSQAEVSLVLALNQKKARSASVYLQEQQQQQQQRARGGQYDRQDGPDGNEEDGEARAVKARPPTEDELTVAEVRQLEHHVLASRHRHSDSLVADPTSPSDIGVQAEHSQIKQNALRRRDAHMRELERYEGAVRDVSERIEAALIATFDRVKEALADIDAQLARIEHEELRDHARLLDADKGAIAGAWDRLEALTKQRSAVLSQLAAALERIEASRVADVRAQLERTTFALMEIAHALGPEVERVVEAEAHQVNVVVIANRKVYADLVARLATANVDVLVRARLSWEQALARWRALRHAQALERFRQMLDSPAFTDPEDRRRIMDALRAHQQRVHAEQRLAALQELQDGAAALTSERVQQVLDRLQAAQQQEEDANGAFFADLRAAHDRRVQDADALQEALRLELHGFGALAREGEIDEAKRTLEHMLAGEEGAALEDFFRSAGGLRGELESVAKRLDVAELIYERNVDPLSASVRVLLSALPLERVMETQGKGAERRALQTTLDRIRKASKADLPALLPLLQAQMQLLLGLEGLSDLFKGEVAELAAQLSLVRPPDTGAPETSASMVQTAVGPDATLSSSTRPLTSSQASTGALAATSGSPSSPSSTKRATSSSSTDFGSLVDVQALRRIQRRLAALVFASELPQPMQQHLQFIGDQLALQSAANRVVDAVVHRECDALLAAQQRAGRLFLDEVGRRMERQSAALHGRCERIAAFHLSVVSTVEKSVARAQYVDLSVLDLLDTLKEHDDDAIGDMEARYAQSCAAVRHAPDPHELQNGFQRCAELLARMEGEYRAYEARVRLASEHNVAAADAQRFMFMQQLAALLGLVAPIPPGVQTGMEQSELDEFLSAKHIEELVEPPATPLAEATAAEDAKAAGDSEKESLAAHAPSTAMDAASKQQPDIETLEVYSLPSGAELRCFQGVQALVEQILSAPDEDEDSEGADTKNEPAEVPEESTSSSVTPSPSPRAAGDGESSVHEEARESAVDEQRFEMERQLARDWLPLEIPRSALEPLIEAFRDAVMAKYDAEGVATSALLSQTREQRFEAAAALLEERLRTHWPRRGRLDVQLFQPRLGELESHRQRTERHVRALLARLESQQRVFERMADELLGEIAHARDAQVAFQAQLPLQTSLAALQGLEARAKKGLAALKSGGHDKLAAAASAVDSDVAALVTSSSEFVRACASQVFPDLSGCEVVSGCDYHPEEVAQLQRALEAVEQQARGQISQRSARVDAIRAELERALGLWPAFKSRCQACMQTLAMKDGLGQKFGLPRRAAQEKFRSEVTRCEDKSAAVDRLVASLQSLCDGEAAAQAENGKRTALDQQQQQQQGRGRSHAILVALMQLRAKIYQCGVYFGFLANTSQLAPLPLEFCADAGDADALVVRDGDVVDELDRAEPPAGGFLGFVRHVSDQCRSDTKALFEQEGKADELPPSGVPAALEEYLAAQADKARSFVGQQELAFQDQLRKLSDLLLVAPGVAVADLLERAKLDAKRWNAAAGAAIDAQYRQLTTIKTRHSSELRPQLSSANNSSVLDDLCVREGERSTTAVTALRGFRDASLASQARSAVRFERELVALSTCLMRLLDTIAMGVEDVKQLNGEPLLKDKRKSLKRLRKLTRVLETGDPKEVPRTDKELEALRQLGEAPRFPKRAYHGVPSFGVGHLYQDAQAQAALEDEAWGLPCTDGSPSIVDSGSGDDGACESLLTPAHRALVRERDAAHADWTAFCADELRAALGVAHERLEDEVKWRASWELGIANMKKTHSNDSAPAPVSEGSGSTDGAES